MGRVQRILRDITPPLLVRWAKGAHASVCAGPAMYAGPFTSWQEAAAHSDGYQADAIFRRVYDSARKVRDGEARYERDGVVFDAIEHRFPLLACLLYVAAQQNCRLRVLDFGGSLGSTYYPCRQWLTGLNDFSWHIVEQAHYVKCGRKEFQTAELQFHDSVEECLAAGAVDIALLSSVLGYLPDPYDALESLARNKIRWLLIDRTAVTSLAEDRICIQNVPAHVFGKAVSYPCHLFSERALLAHIAQTWPIRAQGEALDPTVNVKEIGLVQHKLYFAGPNTLA